MNLAGKRLVIFGCGYVGSALARTALAAGAQVEALTRNAEKAVALRAEGLTSVVVAELASADWYRQIAPGADYVVNCVSASAPGIEGYRQSYVAGQESIIAWAQTGRVPVGTFIYTSSTSVYPQGNGAVVDETAVTVGASPTGAIIRESEIILERASALACRRWFILRLAGIYGPSRHHLLDQLRAGATVLSGSGVPYSNLIHRDDIVSAIMAGLTAPAAFGNEIFNVTDDHSARRAEVGSWLATQLGVAAPVFDSTLKALRGGGLTPDRQISSQKIQQMLGWEPQFPDYRAGYRAIFEQS
jgi:nucleoside-diphosphate-sugar epimerase